MTSRRAFVLLSAALCAGLCSCSTPPAAEPAADPDPPEEERIDRTIAATESFFRSLGLSTHLSAEGLGEATIAEIERRFNALGVHYGEAGNVDGAMARRILEACR